MDSLLVMIMLHSFLEIATDSTSEWVTHMMGALCMVEQHCRGSAAGIFSPEVVNLVSHHHTLHATFLASTGAQLGRNPIKCITWLQGSPYSSRDPLRSRINCYTGLSLELLDIISSITAVTHPEEQDDVQSDPAERLSRLYGIQQRLHELKQWSDNSEPGSLIYLNASAFELATWLYLRRVLPAEPHDLNTGRSQLLERLLLVLHKVHERHGRLAGSLPYPMWALFLAACSVPEDGRAQILEWFTLLKASRPFSNVPSTMNAVISLWKQRDLGHDSETGSLLGSRWEQTIRTLGWKMPLT